MNGRNGTKNDAPADIGKATRMDGLADNNSHGVPEKQALRTIPGLPAVEPLGEDGTLSWWGPPLPALGSLRKEAEERLAAAVAAVPDRFRVRREEVALQFSSALEAGLAYDAALETAKAELEARALEAAERRQQIDAEAAANAKRRSRLVEKRRKARRRFAEALGAAGLMADALPEDLTADQFRESVRARAASPLAHAGIERLVPVPEGPTEGRGERLVAEVVAPVAAATLLAITMGAISGLLRPSSLNDIGAHAPQLFLAFLVATGTDLTLCALAARVGALAALHLDGGPEAEGVSSRRSARGATASYGVLLFCWAALSVLEGLGLREVYLSAHRMDGRADLPLPIFILVGATVSGLVAGASAARTFLAGRQRARQAFLAGRCNAAEREILESTAGQEAITQAANARRLRADIDACDARLKELAEARRETLAPALSAATGRALSELHATAVGQRNKAERTFRQIIDALEPLPARHARPAAGR
jgi:hypothetical protein